MTTRSASWGNDKILRTSDAGASWVRIDSNAALGFPIFVRFASAAIAVAAWWGRGSDTNNHWIQRTTDGGLSWHPIPMPTVDRRFKGLQFFSIQTGYAWGGAYPVDSLFRTDDAGLTWQAVRSLGPHQSIRKLQFLTLSEAYLMTTRGMLRWTTDGGRDWTTRRNGDTVLTNLYSDMTFLDARTGFIAGHSPLYGTMILRTNDSGASWRRESAPGNFVPKTIAFRDGGLGLAGGGSDAGSILKTSLGLYPVVFSLFDARADGGAAMLRWTTVSERNNAGFVIERRGAKEEAWTRRGFVAGHGNTSETQEYQFRDRVEAPGAYRYRLRQIDADGTENLSEERRVYIQPPVEFSVAACAPHPADRHTRIFVECRESVDLSVDLRDAYGRLVRRLASGARPAGTELLTIATEDLAPGVYSIVASSGRHSTVRSFVVCR